ncbi:hypothetical protein KKF34_06395 [Myxococcota bacterium]|nr:hypothetical protein [Myxococcota bacterium]MBU1379840.1 hypothetical protein [Myxococcota bacterium]MBU1496489.1 hypothetical protein [Myxococcota bacterium]
MKMAVFSAFLAFATYMCDGNDKKESTDCANDRKEPDQGLVCNENVVLSEPSEQGVFAFKTTLYVNISSAGIIETETYSRILGILHLTKSPMGEDLQIELCDLLIPAVSIPGQAGPTEMIMVSNVYPELAPAQTSMTVENYTTCSDVSFPMVSFIFSAVLPDPLNDSLPDTGLCSGTSPPCITDMDNDSNPGVTFEALNVPGIDVRSIYMIMRSTMDFSGIIGSEDLLLGNSMWTIEQKAVGCTIVPLGQTNPRPCNESELDIVRKVNPRLEMVPSKAGSLIGRRTGPISCEDLLLSEDEIFGR